MASAVLVTRNEANSFLTPKSMGKIPCRNPNPSFSNNHQFSRKHLINFQNGNGEGEGEELVNSFTASDDASSFNQQYNNPNKKVSLSHYVSYDISRYSRSELRLLKSRLFTELDRVRSLSSRIESGDLVCNVGSKKRPSPFQQPPIMEAKRGKLGVGVVDSYVASQQMMKMCAQVLSKVMKQKAGYVFNEPVDVVGMNLHDYHQIIKRPMDLGTIKKNLGVKGYYPTPDEFSADVRLTFSNALIYNPKGHEVHTLAERFLAKFEQYFQPVYQRFQFEKQQFLRHHHQRVEIQPNDDDVDEVQGSSWSKNPSPEQPVIETPLKKPDPRPEPRVESLPPPPRVSEPVKVPPSTPVPVQAPVAEAFPVQTQEVVRNVGPGRGPSGKLPKPKAKDPNKREMSMEEKHKLGAGLQSLPEEKMSQVIHIIRKRNGHLTQEGDEIELDIEAVDTETLWELDRFVTNYKKMVSKIRRQALMQNNNVGHSDDPNQVGMSERMTETAKVVKRGGDVGDEDVDIGDEIPVHNFPPVEIDKDDDRNQGGVGGGGGGGGSTSSSSSGSSNSDSSSSSDSDSGSSSGSDPDVDDAQSRDNESKNIPH